MNATMITEKLIPATAIETVAIVSSTEAADPPLKASSGTSRSSQPSSAGSASPSAQPATTAIDASSRKLRRSRSRVLLSVVPSSQRLRW